MENHNSNQINENAESSGSHSSSAGGSRSSGGHGRQEKKLPTMQTESRNTWFLVDYENVHADGLNGIQNLSAKDQVIIFYSKNADTMTFDLHNQINRSHGDIQFLKIEAGTKNALDFQLVSYLGYLIRQEEKDSFYIVTKDNGYQAVVKFWLGRNIRIGQIADLSKKTLEEEKKEVRDAISQAVTDKKEIDLVLGYLDKYKTKLGLNNALVKKFDSRKGGELYKLLKPFIKDKKGQ